jgi:hypothetical protein
VPESQLQHRRIAVKCPLWRSRGGNRGNRTVLVDVTPYRNLSATGDRRIPDRHAAYFAYPLDVTGKVVRTLQGSQKAGLNRVSSEGGGGGGGGGRAVREPQPCLLAIMSSHSRLAKPSWSRRPGFCRHRSSGRGFTSKAQSFGNLRALRPSGRPLGSLAGSCAAGCRHNSI